MPRGYEVIEDGKAQTENDWIVERSSDGLVDVHHPDTYHDDRNIFSPRELKNIQRAAEEVA